MDLKTFLKTACEKKASDIHFREGSPPAMRIDGKLVLAEEQPMAHEDLMKMVSEILKVDEAHKDMFDKSREVDVGYTAEGIGRFRVNFCHQQGHLSVAMRRVMNADELDFESLNLPPILKQLSLDTRGFILITGITGSGKTTTLATMTCHINRNRACHIVTIEDPIEIVHPQMKALVTQREVITDTDTYTSALRNVVRQDPDVILIGEMRDAESVGSALKIAEAGHLILSTLHTTNAPETINRIMSFFPLEQADEVRSMLAGTLKAIISQRLVPRASGNGRVPAVEILINTARARDIIRSGEIDKILQVIEEGTGYGMQTFDQSLMDLFKSEVITLETALSYATSPNDLRLNLQKQGLI
ncbi:type IV pili twitching motility protein PilT [Candidatus Desantisbacteria bacterium CG02_land_8_20_14_3_00_49_13]|nr:MAG: type IV pili twitching motility protein PilT [Candidatus Desantisbacteria bacterium CG02_land_8_20_14_3_00_49_13]PJB27980.1 MAG: type IV pili twitching motility protein PilT [Candidatus Desantisbacteria bacterium CG_4_9_14_3_um_filter_50_7]